MTNKIVFANNIQKALWENELRGQLSDGLWENARPTDHWRVWCDAEVTVAKNGEPTGRNFWAQKDNYNLLAPVEYVGEEMLAVAAIAQAFPNYNGFIPDSARTVEFYQSAAGSAASVSYYATQCAEWESAGITPDSVRNLEGTFSMTQLRKELSAMKKIIRTRIQ